MSASRWGEGLQWRTQLSLQTLLNVPHRGTTTEPTGETPLARFNQNLLEKSVIFPRGLSVAKSFFDTLKCVILRQSLVLFEGFKAVYPLHLAQKYEYIVNIL